MDDDISFSKGTIKHDEGTSNLTEESAKTFNLTLTSEDFLPSDKGKRNNTEKNLLLQSTKRATDKL